MESYYSSDEEIAWGPITLREIKGDLKRGPLKKPNRRHTVLCKFQNNKMEKSLSEAVNKLDISGTSTEYFTPNQSLKTNNNSEFLEKLSHVINVPSLEVSEYASVLEPIEKTNSHSDNSARKDEPLIIPHIYITKPDTCSQDDSCMDFVKAVENRETQYNIENFHHTLVENSYEALEEQIISVEETAAHQNDSVETETETDVIILSDDDISSSVEDSEDTSYDETTSFKKDSDLEVHEREFLNKDVVSTTDKTEHTHEYSLEEQECKVNNQFDAGSDTDSTDEVNQQYGETFFLTPTVQSKLSTIKESLSTSPVVVPEIDLTQFDDSLKDDSLQLNDTLEEMNRLLCQGLNYSMSDEEGKENISENRNILPQQLFTPENTSRKYLSSDTKEKPSHIPRYIPTSAEKKINTHTFTKASPKTNFKVPERPPPIKLFTPTASKLHRSRKNIVSPVALYIKNSPRIPLKQKVPLRELPRIVTARNSKPSNNESFMEVDLPEITYRPAKNQIATSEKHIFIPPYLKILNIREGHITKHEGRINCQLDRSKVSKQLLQSDITNCIDQSLLDSSGADTSVLTNKQAFIK